MALAVKNMQALSTAQLTSFFFQSINSTAIFNFPPSIHTALGSCLSISSFLPHTLTSIDGYILKTIETFDSCYQRNDHLFLWANTHNGLISHLFYLLFIRSDKYLDVLRLLKYRKKPSKQQFSLFWSLSVCSLCLYNKNMVRHTNKKRKSSGWYIFKLSEVLDIGE